jgi:hypothetical protein
MSNFCPSVGVPVRPVVIDVMFSAKAVMTNRSVVSLLIAGVPDEATDATRGVMRLLVNVCELEA